MSRATAAAILSLCLLPVLPARADGPGDNSLANVRPIPPPGVPVPPTDRAELEAGLAALDKEIDAFRTERVDGPRAARRNMTLSLLPDVQIFRNAVYYALTYNEFFRPEEINTAKEMLRVGRERMAALRDGTAPWTTQTGLVVRGYVSKIDGSVQPYGLVVPEGWRPGDAPRRLDLWFHGRGENLSELNFLADRMRNPGEFRPAGAFVLHPYGRYCNANKFAGEVDTFEALEHAKKNYAIDENRIIERGFSMGGAASWQFAVHFPGAWAAAAPGAGFSETADFLKVFQNEKVKPTWWEQKLWHQYDCTDYAVNLANLPTVAYSGEKDGQKQAADMMVKALTPEGISLVHIIGANAGHFYTPEGRAEVSRRVDAIAAAGRNPAPRTIRFTTFTLRYPGMAWLTLDGLEQHWERARVDTEIADDTTIKAKTKNVTALTLDFAPGLCPIDVTRPVRVVLDGQTIAASAPLSDRSFTAHFRREGRTWKRMGSAETGTLQKRPGLQGPIDDAFMDSFLMVSPTGTPMNEKTGAWAKGEMEHAVTHWRKQFRGEARVKPDADVTDADIAAHNLILWGDPQSNKILARIANQLPIKWDANGVVVGRQTFAAGTHVPVLIFPNPLNPKRYVVINSGFTFREYDYLNNARQVSKLPDWAVLDITTPPDARWPGKVVDAGFFDEHWRYTEARK